MLNQLYKQQKIRNYQLEKRVFKRGILAISLFFVVFILIILFRLFDLQIINHAKYQTASKNNILTLEPIAPRRGVIYDRNGKLLASNQSILNLTITPNKVANLDDTIHALQKYISLSPKAIAYFKQNLYRYRKNNPIILKYNLSEHEADTVYTHQLDLPGINIAPGLKRTYPFGINTAHVVGYVGRINNSDQKYLKNENYAATNFVGRTGIEKYFENELHGKIGFNQIETNASGKIIHSKIIKPISAGSNLTLSIDIRLQKDIIRIMGNRVGSVVAMDPQTGEILSLVSTPTFDPNKFVNGFTNKDFSSLQNNPHFPLVNRAIHGDFSPGSTIKPFYSYYALSHHWITKNDTVNDPGWFQLPGTKHIFHDDRPGNYGALNITKALILSSDTYFYTLANTLGINRLNTALKYFHYGEATGIQLPNENKGLIPTPQWKQAEIGNKWFPGDTINAGIGQGYVLMTPLQLAQGVSMIANRGIYHKPTLLKLTKQQLQNLQNTSHDNPLTDTQKNAWNTVINAMQGVILNPHGTGWRFGRNPPFTVAAKTGTVQVHGHCTAASVENNASLPEKLRCNQMFIAFAPIKNPQIAIAVVIEHGGSASAIARQVLNSYFQIKSSKPND